MIQNEFFLIDFQLTSRHIIFLSFPFFSLPFPSSLPPFFPCFLPSFLLSSSLTPYLPSSFLPSFFLFLLLLSCHLFFSFFLSNHFFYRKEWALSNRYWTELTLLQTKISRRKVRANQLVYSCLIDLFLSFRSINRMFLIQMCSSSSYIVK